MAKTNKLVYQLWTLVWAVLLTASCASAQDYAEYNEIITENEPVIPPNEGLPDFASRTLNVNVSQFPGEQCNRVCTVGGGRVCYFEFNLENYQAMGVACKRCAQGVQEDCNHPQCIVGDGIEKGVMSINRQVPGPAIQVCQGDYVVVDVKNNAGGTAAAIHWHGLHMVATPYMDGVPFVTQCPIQFATTFRYQFYATEAGTQFYHSHAGHHKINGQYGALIIRQPPAQVPNANTYDYDLPEHHIVLSDWMHQYGEQLFPGLPSSEGIYPDSMLINGRGTYVKLGKDANGMKTIERTQVPPRRYYVTPGRRYRFRVINSVSHACPVQLQIQNHNLTIIASDSHNVAPRQIDTLVSNSGERYDFVLDANQGSGDFWIRVQGLGICSIHPTESFALLRYRTNNANDQDDALRPVPSFPEFNADFAHEEILNHPNATCFGDLHGRCVTELNALTQDEQLRTAVPDHKFFLAFHNYPVPNEELFDTGTYNHFSNLQGNLTIVGAINNLSLVFPDYPPLTQPKDIDESQFCDEFNWPRHCMGKRLCPCIHRIQIRLNSIVELVIVDESESVGRMHHPFHLHGYHFMVTGLGRSPDGHALTVAEAKSMESRRMLPRIMGNTRPPYKDTVSIPSRGYAVVRFRANNPGFWLMHCHYEWHLAIGMGLILQVGRTSQMVKAPSKFPECNNYTPNVRRPRF